MTILPSFSGPLVKRPNIVLVRCSFYALPIISHLLNLPPQVDFALTASVSGVWISLGFAETAGAMVRRPRASAGSHHPCLSLPSLWAPCPLRE